MKKYIFIALIFLISGCSLTVESNNALPTMSMATQTSITSLENPASTHPPSIVNTIPPTLLSLPTIHPSKGIELLQLWFQGTDDCLLPCWAGITPGHTTWEEARQIILPMSGFSTINISENFDCSFGKCDGIGWSLFPQILADGGFYNKLPDDKIHLMILNIQDAGIEKENLIKNISLDTILNKYGVPSMLFLFTEPDLPGQIFLEVTLVYTKKQFVISYSRYAVVENERVVSCGPDSSVKLLVLDNQEQLMSLDALSSQIETKDFHFDVWHKSIEEATGLTIDTFYETYSKENAPCIVTPTKVWQP
jgi:hypothetical protein